MPTTIIADTRELRSGVVKALDQISFVEVDIRTLEVGDYILSDRVCVERKTVQDFFDTLFTRRELFSQLYDLAEAYQRPFLIIEGGNLFSSGRRVHPNAIRGMLSSITVDLQISILYTYSPRDTAELLARMAYREQVGKKRSLSVHGKRSHMSPDEQREYILSAIPGVGTETARVLLRHFGSVQAVITAPEDELMKVKGIGRKTAGAIRELATGERLNTERSE